MRGSLLPFLYGFLACYLLASLAFGAAIYASQQISVSEAIGHAPRWPAMIGLVWDRESWLRGRAHR